MKMKIGSNGQILINDQRFGKFLIFDERPSGIEQKRCGTVFSIFMRIF